MILLCFTPRAHSVLRLSRAESDTSSLESTFKKENQASDLGIGGIIVCENIRLATHSLLVFRIENLCKISKLFRKVDRQHFFCIGMKPNLVYEASTIFDLHFLACLLSPCALAYESRWISCFFFSCFAQRAMSRIVNFALSISNLLVGRVHLLLPG